MKVVLKSRADGAGVAIFAKSGAEPKFIVQIIVVSGILHWNYEIQVYLGNE